jgi:predicted adenine nucleotide alpha hydrolase (AANH) superfamily ATPase
MGEAPILLHICCAPCATTCIERLSSSGYEVILFFSNSNIFPEEEYEKRLENARKLAGILNLRLEVDSYEHEKWLRHVRGLEDEPEQGRRCLKCFEFNLSRASKMADRLKLPSFTTSLSVSRYKQSARIFEQGYAFPKFEAIDFKKKNGYSRSIELSKAYGLYRQNYCGCEFSMRSWGKGKG